MRRLNEASVISEVSVNEASGSLTTVVSGDAKTANGQLSLFFIVYVETPKALQRVLLFPNEVRL
jgi:hypothetical protein